MDLEKYCNLEVEMAKDAIVIAYLKDRDVAVQFYSALCNMRWKKMNMLPDDERIIEKLKGIDSDIWSCSWRHSGGIIADIRNAAYNTKEDYMDFYCSGNEGDISDMVRECFYRMGWEPCPWNNDDNL